MLPTTTMPKAQRNEVSLLACWGVVIAMTLGPSCSSPESSPEGDSAPVEREESEPPTPEPQPEPEDEVSADVVGVRVSGAAGAYTFSVTLSSPDTGCDQYADWWEVLTPDGELIYRRILAHSHVDEQPFTRSGGPVDLQEMTQAIVRAHMNEAGYGGTAYSGSPATGFAADPSIPGPLAPELADAAPQPDGCAF
jgi:hypothetical protein